jgi:hypothetical protein
MQAFDRSEQGDQIVRLAERRLRRYLIWHLQLCRARTITTRDDIDVLLGDRVIVEVAPLRGYRDSRYDKVASAGTEGSQHAERSADLDEDACEEREEPLDLMTCSQCGADAFVRTCEQGGARPVRVVEDAVYSLKCRP